MSQTITNQINKAKVLAEGVNKNIALVKTMGLSSEFINSLISECDEFQTFEDHRDKVKDDLWQLTRQATAKLTDLNAKIKAVKKTIKSNFPKDEWAKFGLTDKQ